MNDLTSSPIDSQVIQRLMRGNVGGVYPPIQAAQTTIGPRTLTPAPVNPPPDEFSSMNPLVASVLRYGKGQAGYLATQALGLPPDAMMGSSWAEAAGRTHQMLMEDLAMAGQFGPREAPVRAQERDVYHGSGKRFTRFDPTKIGTGEGAQAYGYGTYFAENPSVAKFYQNSLKPGGYVNAEDLGARVLEATKGDKDAAITELQNRARLSPDPEFASRVNDAIRAIKTGSTEGAFYKVHIPDEHIQNMLDWDKPLSDQPEIVSRLSGRLPESTQRWMEKAMSPDFQGRWGMTATGGTLHGVLTTDLGGSSDAAAKLLGSSGITGIKYLDATSREEGKGTSNYVIFDPSIVRILERNGKRVYTRPNR